MKRFHIKISTIEVDSGLLFALAISTLAAWPFIVRPSLPTGTDAEIHIFRADQVRASILDGVLYPRWAPDFYYGNGYPIFNYYSPLSYHLAAYYSLVTDLDVVAGAKFVLVLSVYLGTVGMYLFTRDRWSSAAGLVAATAWTFAPYIVFLEPHGRGEVAEMLSLGIAPMIFWTFNRVWQSGSFRFLAAAAVSLAAIIFSHPLTAISVYGFLLFFLLWELLLTPLTGGNRDNTNPSRFLPHVVAAIALGLGLSALYWLPTGLERAAIRLDYYGTGHYDFRRHFIPLTELISPPAWIDQGAARPEFRFSLGPAQWVLGVLGALTIFHRRLRRLDTIFLAFATVAFVYLMTYASLGLWEGIPPMRFLQFPMRFLGPAALALAPMAGLVVRWAELRERDWGDGLIAAVAIVALIATSLPLTYPLDWGDFGDVSSTRIVEEEMQGKWIGTTCCHDFLPIAVRSVPPPESVIVDQYESGIRPVEKFDRASLPEGATITLVESDSEYDLLTVDTPIAFDLKLYRFWFPGWTVSVDGEKIPMHVTEPDGRIRFAVPAGEHEIMLYLGPTPARLLAGGISAIAALAVFLVLVIGWQRSALRQPAPDILSVRAVQLVGLALVLAVGLKIGSDQLGWFRYHSVGREVVVAENQYFATIESEIELLGFDLPVTTIRAGEGFPLTLYWKASQATTRNYQIYVHLRGRDGRLWGQSDKLNPAEFPTSLWSTDKYVRDQHPVQVLPDIPSGAYQIHVGLWDHTTGARFLAYDEREFLLGESVPIPIQVTVFEP